MTVDELLGEWTYMTLRRSDTQGGTKKTYEDTAHRLRRWAKGQDVEGIDLHAYVQAGRADGRAERTLLCDLRLIRSVVSWGIRTNRLPESTRLQIPKLRIDPNLFVINHTTPTPDEAGRVLAAMDHDDWRLAATLLARTGARSGEVVALRWRDVDLARGTVTFGTTTGASKTGIRVFPLDEASLRDLADRTGAGDAPVLEFPGYVNVREGLRRRVLDACRRAGVAPFTPHGLRRMVVGRLIRAGVDVKTAASLTGHSVKVMLQHYQVVTFEDQRAAVDRAGLGRLVGCGLHERPPSPASACIG